MSVESNLKRHLAEWLTFLGVVVACITLYLTYEQLKLTNAQLEQANDQRRWQNYNELNQRYADLYGSIPKVILSGKKVDFSKLKPEDKRWARQYFDLYSEEYWLYQNNLIPVEMWTKRIHCGVRVNLRRYPALIDGYEFWKKEGAFTHPDNFRPEVDNAIEFAISGQTCTPESPAN